MSSLADEGSAALAAVQDASRRLRRCRKRHPGQRLRTALCRAAGRDEGMAAQSNKGIGRSRRHSCLRTRIVGIEQRLPLEQRAQDIEQSIADAAQRPGVAVPAAAQLGVALFADRIMLNGGTSPVIDGVLQPRVAGIAPQHDAALAAAAVTGAWPDRTRSTW